MNYFAHGIRFVENPYFLAGTACPDWLSVSDRPTRLRSRRILPQRSELSGEQRQFADGVLQHLADDDWFHGTRAFYETTAQLGRLFKPLGNDDGFRSGFLGHIAMEMLLDAVLIDRAPERLDAYYAAVGQVDAGQIERWVGAFAAVPPERLAWFIEKFQEVQFLRDYADPARLLHRINQVLSRVKMSPLPSEAILVLRQGYEIVESQADALLPRERFG